MKDLDDAHKRVLGLQLPTDPRWVNMAEMDLAEILTDHAYCEQKAATSCITLIQQYPEKIEMVHELAPIVTEEWGHFRLVLSEMKKRNLTLGRKMFIKLAKRYSNEEKVMKRWKEYLDFEEGMLKTLKVRGDRMH
jgi:tRNA isopentenyl-2-thiomethyl-A-37 hydroxylase MiaE